MENNKIKKKKYMLDANGQVVGRLATQISMILMGKNSPDYTPNIDNKNKVIIMNADKIRFTGKKLMKKVFRHHSMHPGGLKVIPLKKILIQDPKKVIIKAVSKMLPKNKMRTARLLRIKFE